MTVDRTVDRVSELFRVRLDEEAIPSIALAAAAAVVESIFVSLTSEDWHDLVCYVSVSHFIAINDNCTDDNYCQRVVIRYSSLFLSFSLCGSFPLGRRTKLYFSRIPETFTNDAHLTGDKHYYSSQLQFILVFLLYRLSRYRTHNLAELARSTLSTLCLRWLARGVLYHGYVE